MSKQADGYYNSVLLRRDQHYYADHLCSHIPYSNVNEAADVVLLFVTS